MQRSEIKQIKNKEKKWTREVIKQSNIGDIGNVKLPMYPSSYPKASLIIM